MSKKLTISLPEDREKMYTLIRYPAGEIQVRLTEAGIEGARRAEAYEIITHSVFDIMELALLVDAINGINSTILDRRLFAAYLPYARADRRFVEGDCHGFFTFMSQLEAMEFTSIWTFDAHNDELVRGLGISNMLPTHDPVDQLRSIIKSITKKDTSVYEFALILPDQGAVKRYGFLTQYGFTCFVADKVRNPKTGALSGFSISPSIKGYKSALIIDDICDGGGTFLGLGEEIHKYNPNLDLYLYVSHGIFSKGVDCLKQQFKDVFISDYSFIGPETQDRDWNKI